MRAFFVYTTTCIASTCSRAENELVRGVGCHGLAASSPPTVHAPGYARLAADGQAVAPIIPPATEHYPTV